MSILLGVLTFNRLLADDEVSVPLDPQWYPKNWKMPDSFAWHVYFTDERSKVDIQGIWLGEKPAKQWNNWLPIAAGHWPEVFCKEADKLLCISDNELPEALLQAPPVLIQEICWMRKNVLCFGMFTPGHNDWFAQTEMAADGTFLLKFPDNSQCKVGDYGPPQQTGAQLKLPSQIREWGGPVIKVDDGSDGKRTYSVRDMWGASPFRAKVANALTRLMLSEYCRKLLITAAALRVGIHDAVTAMSLTKRSLQLREITTGYAEVANSISLGPQLSDITFWCSPLGMDWMGPKDLARLAKFYPSNKYYATKDPATGKVIHGTPSFIMLVEGLLAQAAGKQQIQAPISSQGSNPTSENTFEHPAKIDILTLRNGFARWGAVPLPVAHGLGHEIFHAILYIVPQLSKLVQTYLSQVPVVVEKVKAGVDAVVDGTHIVMEAGEKLEVQVTVQEPARRYGATPIQVVHEVLIIQGKVPAVTVQYGKQVFTIILSELELGKALAVPPRRDHVAVAVTKDAEISVAMKLGEIAGPPFGGGRELGVFDVVKSLEVWAAAYPADTGDKPAESGYPWSLK